ncbi:MAG: hypothetical protein U0T74_06375 [Chitinophagales bacterium]
MATATIDLKIETAYKKSEALYRKKQIWQEEVDELLDRMNALNKVLTIFHELLLKLSFDIERDMDSFKKSENAPANIKRLVAVSAKLLKLVYHSDLYPGVKTTYRTLKQEVSYLNELVHDRAVSIELEKDDEMKSIIESTLSATKRK